MCRAHRCQRSNRRGLHRPGCPCHHAANAMSHHNAGCKSQSVRYAYDICGKRAGVITTWWVIRCPIPAHVHRGHSEASRSNRWHHMPPQPPERGKAVHQHYQRTLARERYVKASAVCVHRAMLPRPLNKDWRARHQDVVRRSSTNAARVLLIASAVNDGRAALRNLATARSVTRKLRTTSEPDTIRNDSHMG